MILPIHVGDEIREGAWYAPATVKKVTEIPPATEDDLKVSRWLGYSLRPRAAYIQIECVLPNGADFWIDVWPMPKGDWLLEANHQSYTIGRNGGWRRDYDSQERYHIVTRAERKPEQMELFA